MFASRPNCFPGSPSGPPVEDLGSVAGGRYDTPSSSSCSKERCFPGLSGPLLEVFVSKYPALRLFSRGSASGPPMEGFVAKVPSSGFFPVLVPGLSGRFLHMWRCGFFPGVPHPGLSWKISVPFHPCKYGQSRGLG